MNIGEFIKKLTRETAARFLGGEPGARARGRRVLSQAVLVSSGSASSRRRLQTGTTAIDGLESRLVLSPVGLEAGDALVLADQANGEVRGDAGLSSDLQDDGLSSDILLSGLSKGRDPSNIDDDGLNFVLANLPNGGFGLRFDDSHKVPVGASESMSLPSLSDDDISISVSEDWSGLITDANSGAGSTASAIDETATSNSLPDADDEPETASEDTEADNQSRAKKDSDAQLTVGSSNVPITARSNAISFAVSVSDDSHILIGGSATASHVSLTREEAQRQDEVLWPFIASWSGIHELPESTWSSGPAAARSASTADSGLTTATRGLTLSWRLSPLVEAAELVNSSTIPLAAIATELLLPDAVNSPTTGLMRPNSVPVVVLSDASQAESSQRVATAVRRLRTDQQVVADAVPHQIQLPAADDAVPMQVTDESPRQLRYVVNARAPPPRARDPEVRVVVANAPASLLMRLRYSIAPRGPSLVTVETPSPECQSSSGPRVSSDGGSRSLAC